MPVSCQGQECEWIGFTIYGFVMFNIHDLTWTPPTMKKIFFVYLHELEHEKIKIKKLRK